TCLLIDAGLHTEEAKQALLSGLAKSGVALKDIEAALVTHGHVDHFGLAHWLREEADCRIYGHEDEQEYIESFPGLHRKVLDQFRHVSDLNGYPEEEYRETVREYAGSQELAQAAIIDSPLKDREKILFGDIALQALHTPGHTGGSVCYRFQEDLFCGDTILEQITPITFFKGARKKTGPGHYRRSLETLGKLDVRKAYPGHQNAFTHFEEVLRQINRHQEIRKERILKALDRAKKEYKAALCSALGWIRDEESLEALLEAFDDRDWRVRVRALEAVQKIDPSRAGDIVAKAAKAKEYQVRMKAAEYWPAIDKTAASLGLGDLAKDKDWRVRFAVIQATEELRTRECIGWLVSLLGSEEGRLRWDVLMALHSLTGKDLGLNSKNWESWWQFNKDTFEVVPKKTATGGPTVKDTTSTFFEVPILSTRVLFILDLSGSMKDMSPLKDEKGKTMRKLEVAKQGMMATIQSLSPKTKFSIIGLGAADDGSYLLQSQKTWKKKLRLFPANPGSKRDAIKWVRSLEAKGYTNIYDAILYGMEDPEVDSIYLYTDGGASRGIFIKTSEILNFVQRNNEFRKVTLHTIEVPGTSNTKDNIRLLQSLAEESG
ncbi:MAG: MBL fold metallo-hydrolase, partial [Planctomycetota bacterium]|nr:MBL fold metallo-hydrolase [Planctomycetota bacterium]